MTKNTVSKDVSADIWPNEQHMKAIADTVDHQHVESYPGHYRHNITFVWYNPTIGVQLTFTTHSADLFPWERSHIMELASLAKRQYLESKIKGGK